MTQSTKRTGSACGWGAAGSDPAAAAAKPVLAFVGTGGTIEGYVGRIHAASKDRGISCLWANTEVVLPKSFLVLAFETREAPVDDEKIRAEKRQRIRLEQEAMARTKACCLIIDSITKLSEAGRLYKGRGDEIKMIIFIGEYSNRAVKNVGLLFGHVPPHRKLFGDETKNIPDVLRCIVETAAAL
jgi:hypothetical protein